MVLLDTHVWLWAAEGDERRIGRRTRRLLARAESKEAIRISAATLFELTALHTAGRIHLAQTPERWIRESLDAAGARVAELSASIAVDAGQIPLADPLDRLLVATARHIDATFVTSGRPILYYAARTRSVRVHNAST